MDRSARTTPDPRFERDRPAVEVIATFDGAIVDARHFDDPTCGVIRRSTTLQLAGGGVALVLSLLLFVVAYTRGGGTALDITTALLMAGGLTALTRGLLAHHDDRRPRDYTVGTGAGALLPLSAGAIREPLFPLLRSTGAGYELTITSGMVGDVTTEGRTLPLHEAIRAADESPAVPGARAIPVLDGTRARLRLGAAVLHVRSVPAPRRQPVPLRVDVTSLRYTGGVFAAAAFFLVLLFAIPPDASAISLDGADRNMRYAKFVLVPPQVEEPKPPPWLAKKSEEKKPLRGGKLHKGDPAKAGSREAPDAHKRLAIKGPKDNQSLTLARREEAVQMARSAGVLGLMRSRNPMLASLFSTSSNALGADAESALGNLTGLQVGDSQGADGLGLDGNRGPGGGGTGLNTLGVGNLDTIGAGGCGGKGCGDDYGATRKVAGLRGHAVAKVLTVEHATQVIGGLDKELIRRVIRRHANEVKFCYDQALVRQPDLYGKVVVKFSIAPTGAVSTSVPAESTVGWDVGRCVSDTVRRMEFPKPLGGGMVMVTYPFSFRASAQGE